MSSSSGAQPETVQAAGSRLATARLYAILDLGYTPARDAVSVAANLLDGGADLLQLRAKKESPATIHEFATLILPLCREAGVPLIINDHAEIASTTGADGLHLGQDDGTFPDLRSSDSDLRLFGRSTHSLDQARAAAADPRTNYIGFGPLYATPTKPGRPAIGLDDIAAAHSELPEGFPVFCIGGINHETLPEVIAAGARRVVIVSALLQAKDVQAATSRAKNALP